MELNEILNKRRSIRQYKDKSVNHDDLMVLLNAARLAPSWKNSQVARYYVVESEDMLKKVKGALAPFNQDNCKDAPVLIVTTYVINRSGFSRDGTADNEVGNGWGCYDCGMQHMNLLLKATELGLSTLVMGIRDADLLKEFLNIPSNEAVLSVIAIGYSDLIEEMPKRKDVLDIAHFY